MEEVEVKEMFCMIDRKQRGKINHRQLRAFLKKHDAKFSRKSVKNYIKSIDSDGDVKSLEGSMCLHPLCVFTASNLTGTLSRYKMNYPSYYQSFNT
ncbi:hypothetical protein KSF78_0003233 [Schistosoma japonicum]|uniref:SJCHGC09785 protein n=1 Tax=Schistosoma japonicum TaxID=6182 RepID=Q5BQW4_SCHJA|nr:SJCHGC09785 protein [Schistosoma japonicum]KAH8865637.1 hypothetical protein KSF78_0003233 [Schistosoma japonicum]